MICFYLANLAGEWTIIVGYASRSFIGSWFPGSHQNIPLMMEDCFRITTSNLHNKVLSNWQHMLIPSFHHHPSLHLILPATTVWIYENFAVPNKANQIVYSLRHNHSGTSKSQPARTKLADNSDKPLHHGDQGYLEAARDHPSLLNASIDLVCNH